MWARAVVWLRPAWTRTVSRFRTRPISPRLVTVAAGVCSLGVIVALGFGPAVRARVGVLARARSLDVIVGKVSLGWFAVTLEDIRLGGSALPVVVEIREARIDLSPGLSPAGILAKGVDLRITGEPEDVEKAFREWRQGKDGPRGAGGGVPLTAEGVSLAWRRGDDLLAQANGGAISRSAGVWRASFDSCRAENAGFVIEATRPTVQIGAQGTLDAARSARVAFTWKGAWRTVTSSVPPSAPADEPTPPPLPLAGANGPAGDEDGMARWLHLPELGSLRMRLQVASALVRRATSADAHVDIDSIALEVGDGDRRLAIGRGPFHAFRHGGVVEVTFTTQPDSAGTPVSLTASLPLDPGDATLVLAGGPISLALLGVEEGAGGLVDVAKTTLTARGRASLGAQKQELTFDGELAVRGLAINRPSIANETARGIDATVLARGALDDEGGLRLDDGEISLGAFHLVARGGAEQRPDHLAASLRFELPVAPCQALFESIPAALVPTLDGAEISGAFGARGRLAFDSRNLDDLALEWNVDDDCSLSFVPEALARDRFMQPFEHTIYLSDGTLATETTGPNSDNWTPLDRISPYMQVAVLTTEDGAFYRHHGFNRAAMRNALVADLKAGRFVRGASTITMQLAKNLFLFRDKTLSRKLEEIILADYIDETFSKKEAMELYLNVIEFGPDVYGITRAALHYFGRKPDELNLAESLFLASLLPSPIRFHKLAEKPVLSEGWTRHLRQLMAMAAKNDLVSPDELADGLREEVRFHDPKDPLPPPRAPVLGAHFQPPPSPRVDELGQGDAPER